MDNRYVQDVYLYVSHRLLQDNGTNKLFCLFYSLDCDVDKRVADIYCGIDHRKDSLHFH